LKLIIEELESQLEDITSGNKKLNNILPELNNMDKENKYKNFFIRPNNNGLINHLKKENERLRKLVISYEFKNKKYNNINNIYKTNALNNSNFLITQFNFEILKNTKINKKDNICYTSSKNDDKKEFKIIKEYKNNYSSKNIESLRKFKNSSKIIKKPEIKKVKDIYLFDNDYNYSQEKESAFLKYNKLNNNAQKFRTNSLTQRKRKIINTTQNSNANAIKNKNNINNTKIISNNPIETYNNFTSSRSVSKIIKRKIHDSSFNNSIKLDKKSIGIINSYERHMKLIKNKSNLPHIIKTIENRRNDNSSLEKDKDKFFLTTSRQKHTTKIIKKNIKNNESAKEIYYQKPIINKITIYNNINNGYNNTNSKQKIQRNDRNNRIFLRKKNSHNKNENHFQNYTLGN
jgi:hypothetical protein